MQRVLQCYPCSEHGLISGRLLAALFGFISPPNQLSLVATYFRILLILCPLDVLCPIRALRTAAPLPALQFNQLAIYGRPFQKIERVPCDITCSEHDELEGPACVIVPDHVSRARTRSDCRKQPTVTSSANHPSLLLCVRGL